MTRDQTPGANLRISHIHVLLTSLGQHVPLKKINMGFAKVWRKQFFWRRWRFPHARISKTLTLVLTPLDIACRPAGCTSSFGNNPPSDLSAIFAQSWKAISTQCYTNTHLTYTSLNAFFTNSCSSFTGLYRSPKTPAAC